MEEKLNHILKLLNIIECELHKSIEKQNKEQTELKSDCSKIKKDIKKKLQLLKCILNNIR